MSAHLQNMLLTNVSNIPLSSKSVVPLNGCYWTKLHYNCLGEELNVCKYTKNDFFGTVKDKKQEIKVTSCLNHKCTFISFR